jgi:D-beta-D-heptose 7-phosphate kinase/D-beta-D-heptose 1-phosphate adenosyltransferase
MTRVFVNGTFDILHPGHVRLLQYAQSLGTNLLVAIDSDNRVRQLKGTGRPFFAQADRKFMLESLGCKVVLFNTDDELEHIIETYQPDIMVKGSDYINKPIIGEEHCGRIEFFKRTDEHSSTKAIQHLANR